MRQFNMVFSRLHLKLRYLSAVALLFAQIAFPAGAVEVVIPLSIPFELLTQSITKQFEPVSEDEVVMRYESECQRLTLDHPQFSQQGNFIRFTSHGTGSTGVKVFDTCIKPIDWRGYVEMLTTPYITEDWRLKLRIEQSNLYDETWQKGLLLGPIWDLAQDYLLRYLRNFSVDLTPPRDEILASLRPFIAPTHIAQLDAVFHSATVKALRLNDQGINVDLALQLPDNLQQAKVPRQVSAGPLTPEELNAIQQSLQQLDAFLVFVVKGFGKNIADAETREQLFDLLFDSRYKIVPILSGEQNSVAGDPVRTLFIDTWTRLQEIIGDAEQRGVKFNDVVRYAAFLRAGDMLLAIDRAAPGLGIEISADGLRRLARLMQPESKEDPLQYGLEPDPALRELFGFPPRLHNEDMPEPPPEEEEVEEIPQQSMFNIIGLVYAAESVKSGDDAAMKQRLNRWVPTNDEFEEYRSILNNLLLQISDQELLNASLDTGHKAIFRDLVRATALKESCWRQFVRSGKKTTYLRSKQGSIGLMQVNPFVWRGFYSVERLKWNIFYNAEAGTEILLHYWRDYAIAEKKTGSIDNVARATYSVYNAGPGAVKRYRHKGSVARERKVDAAFWKMYQGFRANGTVDLYRCTVIRSGA